MSELLAWAAGLFEGEGCVTANGGGHKLTLSLVNTDLEILERYAQVVGAGTITTGRAQSENRKPQFAWQVYGDNAVTVFEALEPWLGTRRRARYAELAAVREAYIAAVTAPRTCPTCDTTFRPQYTVSSRRRRFCSAACKSTFGVRQHRARVAGASA